eukprot:snap_masked-scaffold_9-processed-gene-11.24-mRNA-1 protein AED:1.00 eAED:1.00 QI:0/0/0/0/1/1/2/0/172
MNGVKSIVLLSILFVSTTAEFLVNLTIANEVVGPFRSTRFSENIGRFSEDCDIYAKGTLLLPEENPCSLSSFDRDLLNLVVVTTDLQGYGCFEETSFKTIQTLGAIAVLNSDPRPAGFQMYSSHFGHPRDETNIPTLDTNFEFFTEVFLRVSETDENFEFIINNCADENHIL